MNAALPSVVPSNAVLAKIGRNLRDAGAAPSDVEPAWIRGVLAWGMRDDAAYGLSDEAARKLLQRACALVEPPPLSSPKASPVASLDWRILAEGDPPPREWIVPGWIGAGHVTLLVGAGGIGKSLLAQQVCSALAVGASCIEPAHGTFRSLGWWCEDDATECWRRALPIASWLRSPISAFTDQFFLVPRQGEDNVLASTEYGRLMFTPRLEELRQQANDLDVQLVVLDNVRHIFAGNENDNPTVTQFMNALTGALRGKALLLLAHPARNAGSEYAGAAAWENAARTRLYLGSRLPDERVEAPDDAVESTARVLARRKANYAGRDVRRFNYSNGVLIPDAAESGGGMVGHLRSMRVEHTILDAARKLAAMSVRFTDGATSPNYLPRLAMDYKLSDGATKRELADAMRAAMLDGRLVRGKVGEYENRTAMMGLRVA